MAASRMRTLPRRRSLAIVVVLLALPAERAGALECLDRYAEDVRAAAADTMGTPTDIERAIGAIRPIAEDGYAPAMYALAQALVRRNAEGDESGASTWMRLAAARGYPPAYAPLGDEALERARAAEGRGESRRARLLEREALFWYRLGEAHSEPDALWGLGEIYRRGTVVTASAETAFNYERSAVEQGVTSRLADPPLAERYARLASDYALGTGTAADAVQSYRWQLVHDQLGGAPGDAGTLSITAEQTTQAKALAEGWKRPERDYVQRAPYAFDPVPISETIVRRLQGALVAAGLEPGPVSGRFTDATARAIVDYEALDGTTAAAAVTHRLIEALRVTQPQPQPDSCSSRWLDQQPAETVFPEPLEPQESADGEESIEDAEGEYTQAPSDAEPGEVLDRVIRNNEAMLRHQMINDAQKEFESARGADEGRVREGAPALCADLREFLAALHAGAGAPVGEACFKPAAGATARVLWCLDPDAYLCELELPSDQPGETRRGWADLSVFE
jgi:hypothetical protein